VWCLEVAGKRTHGTTGLQPVAHFAMVELPALQPLPSEPFELATWTTAKVGPDCHIQVTQPSAIQQFSQEPHFSGG